MRFTDAAVFRHAALTAVLVFVAGCVGGQPANPTDRAAAPAACSVTLSPDAGPHLASGGLASLTVTAQGDCSWVATSDQDWVALIGPASGESSGHVAYSVAPNTTTSARSATITVTAAGGTGQVTRHQVSQIAEIEPSPSQHGDTQSPATLSGLRGTYTFRMQVDRGGACGWPVTSFMWPVSFAAASNAQNVLVGSLVFPPTPSGGPGSWTIRVSPKGIDLLPVDGSPGAAAAAYDLVVEGGRWVADGLTRAEDGRQEIVGGTASGARLVLVLPGSDRRWECRTDVAWSLVTRFIDRD